MKSGGVSSAGRIACVLWFLRYFLLVPYYPSTLASSWLKALRPTLAPRLTRALRRALAPCLTRVLRRPLAPHLAQCLRPNLRLKHPRERTQSRGGTIRARRASDSQTVALCVLAWIRPGGMWQDGSDPGVGTPAGTELSLTRSLSSFATGPATWRNFRVLPRRG